MWRYSSSGILETHMVIVPVRAARFSMQLPYLLRHWLASPRLNHKPQGVEQLVPQTKLTQSLLFLCSPLETGRLMDESLDRLQSTLKCGISGLQNLKRPNKHLFSVVGDVKCNNLPFTLKELFHVLQTIDLKDFTEVEPQFCLPGTL